MFCKTLLCISYFSKKPKITHYNYWYYFQFYIFKLENDVDEGESNNSHSSLISLEEETASLASVDSYIELLYEEIPEKVRASGLVLKLARDTGNLNVLRKNGK